MEDATETRYWCHMCSRFVNPVIDGDFINCNSCDAGFVEEMDNAQVSVTNDDHQPVSSLWAPILMGMMNDHDHHTMNRSGSEFIVEDEDDDDDNDDNDDDHNNDGEVDINQQLEEMMRRRRRHSAAVVDLLQGIRAGLLLESEANADNPDNELMVLINSFNQRIRVHQDSIDTTSVPSGSLGDYFIGPGFETLLQSLADNDPNNRFGTPPAQKEAVEALAMVKIEESLLQCTVCLDDFEIGMEAKEMPCKHKFHSDCLLPWLELHSSCPVCRYLLPTGDDDDELKTDAETLRNGDSNYDLNVLISENNGSSPDSSSNN